MAQRYLLDTNICIYIAKYNPPAVRERFAQHSASELAMSVITLGELRFGAEKSQSKEKALIIINELANLMNIEEIPETAAEHYGQIRAELQKSGQIIGNNDLWIAANFVETDLTHVHPGQKVQVTVDTYPDVKWQGEVQSVSPATGSEFSVIPAQNATGNWVKIAQRVPVKISLAPNADAPILQAGLSTHIEIDTGYRRNVLGVVL